MSKAVIRKEVLYLQVCEDIQKQTNLAFQWKVVVFFMLSCLKNHTMEDKLC